MVYLSKGVVQNGSSRNNLVISRCGKQFTLSGDSAVVWLRGRFQLGMTDTAAHHFISKRLINDGLVEATNELGDISLYRLFLKCVICHAKPKLFCAPLTKQEKILWIWISQAGGKLTISELIWLFTQKVEPDKSLLGKNNWSSLIHTIYSVDTIADNILETQMESSPALAETTAAVLGLLRKKRIFLI